MSIWDNMAKGEDQFHKHAEEIFLNYKAEFWNVDEEKGKMLVTTTNQWRDNKGKLKEEQITHSLADLVSKALSNYEIERGSFTWSPAARELIRAYTYAQSHNAIGKTEGFMNKFREMQEENRSLRKTIDDLTKEKNGMISNLTKERDGFKKRWEECEQGKPKVETSIVEDEGEPKKA